MRGFKDTKQANSPVLGEAAYQHFIKAGKVENKKTEEAKRRFKTPPYYFGERRKKDEHKGSDNCEMSELCKR